MLEEPSPRRVQRYMVPPDRRPHVGYANRRSKKRGEPRAVFDSGCPRVHADASAVDRKRSASEWVIVIYAWTRLEGNIVYGSHGPEMEYSAMRSAYLAKPPIVSVRGLRGVGAGGAVSASSPKVHGASRALRRGKEVRTRARRPRGGRPESASASGRRGPRGPARRRSEQLAPETPRSPPVSPAVPVSLHRDSLLALATGPVAATHGLLFGWGT